MALSYQLFSRRATQQLRARITETSTQIQFSCGEFEIAILFGAVGQQIANRVEAIVIRAALGTCWDIFIEPTKLFGLDGAVQKPVPGRGLRRRGLCNGQGSVHAEPLINGTNLPIPEATIFSEEQSCYLGCN
jgi:hypothetical protein